MAKHHHTCSVFRKSTCRNPPHHQSQDTRVQNHLKAARITAIAKPSTGTRSSFMLNLWGVGAKGGQRVWTACYHCPPCPMSSTDTLGVHKASITATQTADSLLGISDSVGTVRVGRRGNSSPMQNFTAKQSCNFLLVRVLV